MGIEPFPFDMTMRPVKYVEASGGVFVCGGQQTASESGKIDWVVHRKDGSGDWGQAFRKTEGTGIYPYCGAYATVGEGTPTEKPTFIMAGVMTDFHGDPLDLNNSRQIIMTSHNGRTWSETHREAGGLCYTAGWDETAKKFYVQCMADIVPSEGKFKNVVLGSSDGSAWSQAAEKVPGTGYYAHALLTGTGVDLVKDAFDKIVPNGSYYGWDKDGNRIIRPKILLPYNTSGPGLGADNKIEIIKLKTDPNTGEIFEVGRIEKTLPIDQVNSVAYVGGTWHAGGFMFDEDKGEATLKIAKSGDDGDTWTIDYTVVGDTKAFCLMAAPAEVFA